MVTYEQKTSMLEGRSSWEHLFTNFFTNDKAARVFGWASSGNSTTCDFLSNHLLRTVWGPGLYVGLQVRYFHFLYGTSYQSNSTDCDRFRKQILRAVNSHVVPSKTACLCICEESETCLLYRRAHLLSSISSKDCRPYLIFKDKDEIGLLYFREIKIYTIFA